MVPTWTFDIFISVSYFHISFKFSPFDVWFLRGRLIFSYQFDIFISVSYFHISLQFSCHNSITSLCVASQPVSHGPIETDNFPMFHSGLTTLEDRLTADQRSRDKGHQFHSRHKCHLLLVVHDRHGHHCPFPFQRRCHCVVVVMVRIFLLFLATHAERSLLPDDECSCLQRLSRPDGGVAFAAGVARRRVPPPATSVLTKTGGVAFATGGQCNQ